jgi:hypothetical protein
MQLIPSPEGANFFFDFKVLGYPNANDGGLLKILKPLIKNNEVPYTKWVCLSDDLVAFDSLHRGKNSDNWQLIVDKLGTPPIQFSADSFMRLKGPYKNSDGTIVQPSYIEEKQSANGQVDIRKTSSLYDLDENESYSFEIISYSPPPSDARSSEAQRKVISQTDKDGPLSLLGDSEIDLRQYTGKIIRFKAKRYEEMDQKIGSIRFDTGARSPDNWPLGANFSLTFRVNKRTAKAMMALLTGVVAAVLLLFATKIYDKSVLWGVVAGIVGTLLAVITVLLISGKLSFKL